MYVCAHAHTYAIEKTMNLKERREEWIGGLYGRSAGSPGYSLKAENQVETCNFSSREAKAEAQKFKVILSSTEPEAYVEYQDPVSK